MSLGFTFNEGPMARAKKDLDLRKLEVFYWVAELRSFSLAAEHLSLRQPTVSAHIRELEQKLDARLDRKSTRLNSSHIQKSRMPSSA